MLLACKVGCISNCPYSKNSPTDLFLKPPATLYVSGSSSFSVSPKISKKTSNKSLIFLWQLATLLENQSATLLAPQAN